MSDYERLREWFTENAEVSPADNEGREAILDAITAGRVASFVDEVEQVQSLASLGFGRAAVADAMDRTPDEVDELAREAGRRLDKTLGFTEEGDDE